ncbi:helix-turn-helix domain-containing protein [Novosphingobium sp. 1949]|uniref:Helix-turn-helix domain-containing protein n=1 Tax=Novosphingobium organovorum TaxID=2930092 RepID=A0ABT0BEV9_9SPHN|nr:helix-turn-helix domain-containing protein [Novosphingobium organovorum]MCJ2183590.1 helix-turn-helix domain-containing protein [Novosphingobium organovorum]
MIGRALDILRIINLQGSPSLVEITRAVDLPYPTVLRIVRALVEEGVIEREPARKRYRPTAMVQALSYGFQNHDALVAAARAHIEALTRAVHWPVCLVTRVGNMMVVRDSTSTQTPLTFDHYYPGWQIPLIQSASGRVFLAYTDRERRLAMIDHIAATGSKSVVQMLRDFEETGEADLIREQGYATVARIPFSSNPGRTSSFAVPIHANGTLLGALTLVFFANAMTPEEASAKYFDAVLGTAQAIGREMESV